MHKIASALLSLTTTLSQLKTNENVISLYIQNLGKLYPNSNFYWSETKDAKFDQNAILSTPNQSFGFINYNTDFNSEEAKNLFLNSVQMVAVILENLSRENQLTREKENLIKLTEDNSKSMYLKEDELNKINEEYYTLNEELIKANRTLYEINNKLQNEIQKHKETVRKLKKSESYFREIFNHSAVGKSITSVDGKMDVNDSFCSILGYSKEELTSCNWRDITYPDDIEQNELIISEMLDGKRNSAKWQKRYVHKNGQIIWTEINTTLRRNLKNKPKFFITTIIDITAMKLANKKIADGEEKLANIIAGTRVGTWEWNVQTGETNFNEMWANIIGYKLNELEPTSIETWVKFSHPDDLLKSNEQIQKHFNKEIEYYEIETRMKHRNGSWVWVLDRGKVSSWTQDGKPLLMHGTHQDITEKKNAEIALRNSENLLNLSQKISLIGNYTMDIPNKTWYSSEMLDEIFEIDDNYNKTTQGWIELLHDEDKDALQNYLINDVFGNYKRFDREYRIVSNKNKKVKWVHGIGELEFDKTGNAIKMIGTIQDITERKRFTDELYESNELLSQFVLHSPIYAYIKEVTPTHSKVLKVSENYIDMLGIPISEMIGKTMQELFPKELADSMTADDWRVVSKGESIKINEELNGRYYTSIKFPINLKNKYLLAGYTIDITESKQTELLIQQKNIELQKTNQKLKAAKEKAEESDRLKTSFLTNMSHEIRTPLNSIMGFASLLPEEESPGLISKYAQIIEQNSEQLVSIIDGIVLYSKLQTGLLKLNPSQFKIYDLLADVAVSFDLPDYKKIAALSIAEGIDKEATVYSDYDKLRQVLNNLISNAFKYTPHGEIILNVKAKDSLVEFNVKDTGIGIPSEEINHIFERFYRGSNVEKSTTRGTGLGLSIAKELVELLGGTISVKSQIGKGTTFIFTIKPSTQQLS